jgi:hypothetical protein
VPRQRVPIILRINIAHAARIAAALHPRYSLAMQIKSSVLTGHSSGAASQMQRRSLFLCLAAFIAKPSLALYDPKPSGLLVPALGSWSGTLVYADYQNPDKLVTLQTRLVVTLTAPEELSLYYVFDDGPGKTVYSYERMSFDATKNELIWTSGVTKPNTNKFRVVSASAANDGSRFEFERAVESGVDKYTFEVKARSWFLAKQEVRTGKRDLQRSKYEFVRL